MYASLDRPGIRSNFREDNRHWSPASTAGQLLGMITDRDVCMAAYLRGQPLHARPVLNTLCLDDRARDLLVSGLAAISDRPAALSRSA
jgi:hypothetical protein